MKILEKSFAGRLWLFKGGLFAFLLAGFVVQSEAMVYTLNSSPSIVMFDTSSGLTSWQVGGQQQLTLQSFYYSLGGGPLSSVVSLGAPTITSIPFGNPNVTATYSSSGVISVKSTFTLNGNVLSDTIKVQNLSSGSQTISLFQFSDFVLGGASGSQNVNMFLNSSSQAEADQTGGGVSLVNQAQFVGTAGTTEMQADTSGALFGPFLGPPNALTNVPLSASGNAVYAYQWDATLPSNLAFTISETSYIVVPEPSSVVLIASGMFALGLLRRRHGKV